jgi:hypothetical protein
MKDAALGMAKQIRLRHSHLPPIKVRLIEPIVDRSGTHFQNKEMVIPGVHVFHPMSEHLLFSETHHLPIKRCCYLQLPALNIPHWGTHSCCPDSATRCAHIPFPDYFSIYTATMHVQNDIKLYSADP